MCEICGEIQGHAGNDLLAAVLGGPYRRRVLYETSTMAVLPSVGPLVAGHVLLCPKRHLNRIASVQRDEEVELGEMKAFVANVLSEKYGVRPQFFEHGSSLDGSNIPCTVAHAHLHAVPVASIWDELPSWLSWTTGVISVTELASAVGSGEYLYYEDDLGRQAVCALQGESVQSQLLRQIIAAKHGDGSAWNWREHPKAELLAQTVADLEPMLQGVMR